MSSPLGLYIHIPFCDGKCPYCDFYSVAPNDELRDAYTGALVAEMARFSRREGRLPVDTVYIGGGTPPQLGAHRLARVLESASDLFAVDGSAEITVEVNPRCVTHELIATLRSAGVNRLSMGVQSGVDSELAALGRRHTAADAARAAEIIHTGGIDNLSLDLMLAIPGQNADSLEQSVDFLTGLAPSHISAYLLKLEPGTPYYVRRDALSLPEDDVQAELYTLACELVERHGYAQYEISNFAREGFASRHNLKYWGCEEYVGFGPAAHSYFSGRRYFYPRDLTAFLSSPSTVDDGEGGSREEYAMLCLRLAEGLREKRWQERFGEKIPCAVAEKAKMLEAGGLVELLPDGFRLTRKGMLVSNAVIACIVDLV